MTKKHYEDWEKSKYLVEQIIPKLIKKLPYKTYTDPKLEINSQQIGGDKTKLHLNSADSLRGKDNSPSQQTSVVNREIVHSKEISNVGENPILDTIQQIKEETFQECPKCKTNFAICNCGNFPKKQTKEEIIKWTPNEIKFKTECHSWKGLLDKPMFVSITDFNKVRKQAPEEVEKVIKKYKSKTLNWDLLESKIKEMK